MSFNGKALAELSQKLLGGQAVKILNKAVVVENFKVIRSEINGKEGVELLIARIIGMGGAAFERDLYCTCRTVMSVRDVKRGNPGKAVHKSLYVGFILNDPNLVTNAAVRDEIILGREGGVLVENRIYLRFFAVSEENRACVRVAGVHMADSVLLLVGTGKLVALYHTV